MARLFFLPGIDAFIFKHPIYGIDECVTALMIWSMCLDGVPSIGDNGHAVLSFHEPYAKGIFAEECFHIYELF